MKSFFIQLLILFGLSFKSFASPLILNEEEKNYIINNPTITIAMISKFGNFSYIKDNQAVGFEHDILKIISSKTGLKFKKKINQWPLIYNQFKFHQFEMISSISYTKYRSQFTLYTTPYYTVPVRIFLRDDYQNYAGLKSLKGKKIGIIKNIFFLAKLKKLPDINLVYFDSHKEMVKSLYLGNIDALIHNVPTITEIIKKNGYTNIIEVDELRLPDSNKEDLRFGIQSTNPHLHSIIQKSLSSISEKSYNKLRDKWSLTNYRQPVNYTLIFLIISIGIVFISLILYLIIKNKNKELVKLSTTDELTNIYNRRKIEEVLQEEIYRSQKFNSNFALILLDIDYFKDVNDTYGHQIGDIVLTQFANILKDSLRKTDFIGRYGGEEFMLICPGINENEIFKVIESLRLKIANANFKKVGKKTASFGITSYRKDDKVETIIKRVDDALYQAKNTGRNKSVLYT